LAQEPRLLTFERPFERPSLGVGPNPYLLVIENGRENEVASLVIIQAFQSLQHSLLGAPTTPGAALSPDKEYGVDVVQVGETEIAEHNSKYPSMSLPSTALYGIGYKIKYRVRDKANDRRLLMELKPLLNHRGKGSAWREYKRAYSGEYFGNRVLGRISEQFAALPKDSR
jgi:hypothetical protein